MINVANLAQEFPALGLSTEKLDIRSFKSMSLQFIQDMYADLALSLQLFNESVATSGVQLPPDYYCPLVQYGRTRLCDDDLLVEFQPHNGVQLDQALVPYIKTDRPEREHLFLDILTGIFYALDFLYGRAPLGDLCIRSHLRLDLSTIYLTADHRVLLGMYSLPCNRSESILTGSKNAAFDLDRQMLHDVLLRIVGTLNLVPSPTNPITKTLLSMLDAQSNHTFEGIAMAAGFPRESLNGYSHRRPFVVSPRTSNAASKLWPPLPPSASTSTSGAHVPAHDKIAHNNSDYFSGTMNALSYLTTSQLRLMKLSKSTHGSYFGLTESTMSDLEWSTAGLVGSGFDESIVVPNFIDHGLIPEDTLAALRGYYTGDTRKSFISAERICPTQPHVAGLYQYIRDNTTVALMRDKRVLTLLAHEDVQMQLYEQNSETASKTIKFLTEISHFECIMQAAFTGVFLENKKEVPDAIKNTLTVAFPRALGCLFHSPDIVSVFFGTQQLVTTLFNGLTEAVSILLESRRPGQVDSATEEIQRSCRTNLQLVFSTLYQHHEAAMLQMFQSKQAAWNALIVRMAMCPTFSKEVSPILTSAHLHKSLVNDLLQELQQITPTSTFVYSQKLCICEHLRVFAQINSALFYSFTDQITNLHRLIINLLTCTNYNIQLAGELINVVVTFVARLLYLDVHAMTQKKHKDSFKVKVVQPTVALIGSMIRGVAAVLNQVSEFSKEDTFRVYYGLLFVARLYCSVGYMFKYITESCVPGYTDEVVPNPYSWMFYDTPGSAHIVGTAYLGLGDIIEWKMYQEKKEHRMMMREVFVLTRSFLTPELYSLLRKINTTEVFMPINSIQCLLARIRHAMVEIETLLLTFSPPVHLLNEIGYTARLKHYIDCHRNGVDYHSIAERPIELVLLISTLHTIVNFASGTTLTDFYISRCSLMSHDTLKGIKQASSSSETSAEQIDSEQETDLVSEQRKQIHRRSPTTLLEYCHLVMEQSSKIEPLCISLGVEFTMLQEAITAFDLIHVFGSCSRSASIKLDE